jgi:hypothetical protein
VRTWPSTIFWRAVEKPDIYGPCDADCAAGKGGRIFETWLAKTQQADGETGEPTLDRLCKHRHRLSMTEPADPEAIGQYSR